MSVVKPYCEACKAPASRSRWEFASDPEGRLCASCVAEGVSVQRSPGIDGDRYYSQQGDDTYAIDATCMRLLRQAHQAKLRGEVEPLTRPDELSVYNPAGWSCVPEWNIAPRQERRRIRRQAARV